VNSTSHIPLPFAAETKFDVVHEDVKAWYPKAIIVFDKIERMRRQA